MFYNNYYNFSTILVLMVIYIILNQINNKKLNYKKYDSKKDDSGKDDSGKDDSGKIGMIEKKYDSCGSGYQIVYGLKGQILSEGQFKNEKRVGSWKYFKNDPHRI